MEMKPDEVPPWGTADGVPASPATWLELLSEETVTVVERAAARGFDLRTKDGAKIGSVITQTAPSGRFLDVTMTPTYQLLDATGRPVGSIMRAGTLAPCRFMVTDVGGAPVGLIEQEFASGVPVQLLLTTDGAQHRLAKDPSNGLRWHLKAATRSSIGRAVIWTEFERLRLFRSTHRYVVKPEPALLGASRLLVVLAPIGLDYMEHPKRR